jgi:hypothetical protein
MTNDPIVVISPRHAMALKMQRMIGDEENVVCIKADYNRVRLMKALNPAYVFVDEYALIDVNLLKCIKSLFGDILVMYGTPPEEPWDRLNA